MSSAVQSPDTRVGILTQAIRRAAGQLLSQQDRRGFWWAELTADTTLESDYIMLQLWMHPPRGGAGGAGDSPATREAIGRGGVWNPPTRELIDKAAQVGKLDDGVEPLPDLSPGESKDRPVLVDVLPPG